MGMVIKNKAGNRSETASILTRILTRTLKNPEILSKSGFRVGPEGLEPPTNGL
ncbi:MAG: hypothetical protein JWQ98_1264 [Chlorobi bacterium]|nr:hypothetical protein [Chlorobiota bacterium]